MVLGSVGREGEGRNIETPDIESWAYFTFGLDSDSQDTRPLSLILTAKAPHHCSALMRALGTLPFHSTDLCLRTSLGSS